MKHITKQYGQRTNLLELTEEDYRQLEGFLKELGVRTRRVSSDLGAGTTVIQAENPYKVQLELHSKYHPAESILAFADKQMTDDEIARYKW